MSDSTAWGWHHRIFTLMQIALVLIVLATFAVTALINVLQHPCWTSSTERSRYEAGLPQQELF